MWTIEPPREEGYYWFYGHIYGYSEWDKKQGTKPRLEQVQLRVMKGRNSDGSDWYAYVANGAFIDNVREAIGFWHPNVPPDKPNKDNTVLPKAKESK
jgi:hypothetical protein